MDGRGVWFGRAGRERGWVGGWGGHQRNLRPGEAGDEAVVLGAAEQLLVLDQARQKDAQQAAHHHRDQVCREGEEGGEAWCGCVRGWVGLPRRGGRATWPCEDGRGHTGRRRETATRAWSTGGGWWRTEWPEGRLDAQSGLGDLEGGGAEGDAQKVGEGVAQTGHQVAGDDVHVRRDLLERRLRLDPLGVGLAEARHDAGADQRACVVDGGLGSG